MNESERSHGSPRWNTRANSWRLSLVLNQTKRSAAFGLRNQLESVVHPSVEDLDDETLKAELLRTARRLFNLPDE